MPNRGKDAYGTYFPSKPPAMFTDRSFTGRDRSDYYAKSTSRGNGDYPLRTRHVGYVAVEGYSSEQSIQGRPPVHSRKRIIDAVDIEANISKRYRGLVAHAMYLKIQDATDGALQQLRCLLQDCGQHGFYETTLDTRIRIKEALNSLMEDTLRETDIIIWTVAEAAKATPATNFRPSVVYIDESARLTELKPPIPFSLYSPVAFILAADHKQLSPTIQSADGP